MIDQSTINNYKHYTFIGADWKSGYNMSNRYMIKYDNDIRQYYVFPVGRILNRIYVFPKGQAIDASRTVVGYMLAYEDTDLPIATRQEIFQKLPTEIQDYLKKTLETEQTVVYTDIKTADIKQNTTEDYTDIKTEVEPELAPAEPKPKHKGGRPRTREATGRKYVHIWINETEHEAIKQLLSAMRAKK